jgi:hypothetical protein
VSTDIYGHDLTTPATGIYSVSTNFIVIPSAFVVMYYKQEILFSLGSSSTIVLFTELECPLPCSPKLVKCRPLLMPIPRNIFFSLRLILPHDLFARSIAVFLLLLISTHAISHQFQLHHFFIIITIITISGLTFWHRSFTFNSNKSPT